jgi:EmrB/QacA subfamily drug resistance transporter
MSLISALIEEEAASRGRRDRSVSRGRYRWTLAIVAVSAFMITMDNTVVTIAGRTLARELALSPGELRWVTVGYILMFSCLMIAGGRLTDIYGARLTFVGGMAVFTGASLVSGLAPNEAVLILARVVQGSGAALALPATLVMVTVGRSDKQTSLGQIVYMVAAALAIAAGPSVGGLIVEHAHWGWIFLINVPVGVAVIALGLLILPGRGGRAETRVDLPGVLISATLLFALAYATHVVGDLGWTHPAVLGVLALAGFAALSFVVVESWAPDPMIDLEFFRNPVFTGGVATSLLWGVGFNGVMFYSALFMQDVLGFKPTTAALAYLPAALVVLVMTPVAYWLTPKVGSRLTISGGMVLMAGGMAMFTMLRQGDRYVALMPGIVLVSIGSALTMPLAMMVLKSVADDRVGVAGGILNVVRELSAGMGIAVLGVVVDALERSAYEGGADKAEAFRQGASVGLLAGAALVLVGAVVAACTMPVRERPEPAGAEDPEPEPARSWTGPFPIVSTGPFPVVPAAWPPPPPPGWYHPYDPGDGEEHVPDPLGLTNSRFRGDAW